MDDYSDNHSDTNSLIELNPSVKDAEERIKKPQKKKVQKFDEEESVDSSDKLLQSELWSHHDKLSSKNYDEPSLNKDSNGDRSISSIGSDTATEMELDALVAKKKESNAQAKFCKRIERR